MKRFLPFVFLLAALFFNDAARADDHGDNMGAATAWAAPDATGTMDSAADQDWFRFTVTVPGAVWLYSSGGTDVTGSLLDAAGERITFDQNDGNEYNFQITSVLAAGTYFLSVTAGTSALATGAYGVHIRSPQHAPAFDAPNLDGTLTAPGDLHLYRFTTPASGRYWLRTSGPVDTDGYLYDAAGNRVTFDTGSGTDYNFALTLVLNAGQTYYLLVRGGVSALNTGTFKLSQRHFGNALNVAGTGYSGSREVPGDLDLYRIVVGRAGLTWFYSTGATDTMAELYDTGGERVTFDADSGAGANFEIGEALAAGTYYLMVSGGSSAAVLGDYRLEIRQPSTAMPLPVSDGLAHSIGVPGDRDLFVFQSGAGAAVFSSTGTTDVTASLYDAGGNRITFDSNSNGGGNFRIASTLPAGTFYLLVYGGVADLTEGAYTLNASYSNGGTPVSVSSTAVAADGSNQGSLSVVAGGAWSVSGLPAWASVSSSSGSGNATLGFTFQPNTTGTARMATVNVAGGLVLLTQPAATVPLAGPGLTIEDAVILTLQTSPAVTYAIEFSTDLQSWTATGVTLAGDGSVKSVTLPRKGGSGWFRAAVR